MIKITVLLLTFLVGICPFAGVSSSQTAVPSNHPFLEMLSHVPGSATDLGTTPNISYVDYRALEQAREGVPTYQSWAEWNQAQENDDLAGGLWLINSRRIQSGPSLIFEYFRVLDTMPEVMGFDVFEIDRALTFNNPPQTGFIYAGDFDLDAIAAAHTARNYTMTEVDGIELWCGEVGCENGFEQNLQERDVANIFGGDLGRQFPFALTDGYIMTSGDLTVLEEMIGAAQDEQDSILDVPEYLALAEASVQGDGLLVQAQFYNIVDFNEDELPSPAPYINAALVDKQEGSDQIAMLLVVYENEADAQAAAESLTESIANFAPPSMQTDTPIMADENINGSADEPSVYFSESTGLWVAIASIRYPTPSDDEVQSGLLFRAWIQAVYRREFTPLMVTGE